MAWWRSGASPGNDPLDPPDVLDSGRFEWERSPWDSADRQGEPLPGSDVLSSDRPAAKRREPTASFSPPTPTPEADGDPTDEDPAEEDPAGRRRRTIRNARAWTRRRRGALLPMAVFAAGALLGSVCIHAYDTESATRARRETVNLTARVAEDNTPQTGARQPWILRVIVTNSGQTGVLIQAASLADGRFQSHLRTTSEDTQIQSGQESWIWLDVTDSCVDGGPAPAPQAMDLTVVPSGRPSLRVRVRLADDASRMVDAARQNCLNTASDIWTSAELSGHPTVAHTELRVPIKIHLIGPDPLSVQEIQTGSPGLSVLAAPLPVRFSNGVTAQTILRWTVADCARAKVLTYAEVGITATVLLLPDDMSVRTDVVLDANVVLAIVRYVTARCV